MKPVQISQIGSAGLDLDEEAEGGELSLGDDLRLAGPVTLRGRVERGDEGSVHVRGVLKARVAQDCARCVSETRTNVDQDLDLFFLPQTEGAEDRDDEEGVELSDRDLVVAFYRDDFLDLSAIVREQILLAQPMKRLCREDCRGVCPTCGANRNERSCACAQAPAGDAPFQPLAALLVPSRKAQ